MSCRGYTNQGTRCQNYPSDGYYCHLHGPGSRYISETIRHDVFYSNQGRCFHCGKTLVFANRSSGRGHWEPDHLIPYSQGGLNTLQNLVASCYDCNRGRSDTSLRDFGNGERRCEGFTLDGRRCSYNVALGNYKYCRHHSP